ncbi:hypothetical protein G6F46_010083 [Rhizopus delemar]|nr:hypothetical protein G6F55_009148 [Rhizopus delemar]KAG1537832.1 hypothetical protein G6F51_010135 [Rhizopus arrhizus]KAG1491965.1 hypothetical protein G6F54_009641 [Rhizopus delemar]KAG1506269.1 hypothetical protein G6F53_009811 [Rhizopus delemar]KAG1549727.1 hypothetical protein G6F49_009510 [Rhizopus delemar]
MSDLSFEHFDPEYELGNLDANGKPIKPRKKPGRKPNPPSPAQRKAQNRAAQRAFRERKRREMKEAESNNKRYLQMRDEALKECKRLRAKVQELDYENKYLKGQLLTFKITCMAKAVDVPKFYDTGFRDKMGADMVTFSKSEDIPQSLEFFLNHKRYIITGEPDPISSPAFTLASTLSSFSIDDLLNPTLMQSILQPDLITEFVHHLKDIPPTSWLDQLPTEITSLIPLDIRNLFAPKESPEDSSTDPVSDSFQPQLAVENDFWTETETTEHPKLYVPGPMPPLEAVLKMRTIKEEGGDEYLLTPTELQRNVPHDPRIDLVPGPMMRDYMILFQDYYDANELFNYLLEHALFIGGELGNPDCWFVPPEFISQYWFLCPNYLPTRLDNSVQVAVVFAQKMIEHLKRRKEMYIMRDKHMEEFPQPTASDLDPSRIQDKIPDHLKGNASFDLLVLHHINRDVPRIISPNAFTVLEENNKRTKIEPVEKEEGEVLLTIDDEGIQPTAQELVDLAMDEFIQGDDAMAHGLFRMALDQFQKENKSMEVEAGLLQTDEESDDGVAVDEVAYEALLLRQQVPKEEIELYEEALGYAFEIPSSEVDVHEWKCLIQELKTYGLALDLPLQQEHANTVLNAVIELIQQVPGYSENWELISFWTACLTHQEKLLNKTQERIEVVSKAIELAYKANELHVTKLSKEHPFIWELLAGLLMTKSSLVDDEVESVLLYDSAVESYKKAHQLTPEKIEIAEMIKVLEEMKETTIYGEFKSDKVEIIV